MNEKFFERGLSKKFLKVNFIFSCEPSSFLWTQLQKTKGLENSYQFFFRLQNSSEKKSLLGNSSPSQFSCSYFEVVSELFKKLYLLIHASQFTMS